MIDIYETFKTKGCTYEIIFGDFNYQPIPSDYYDLLNDDNDDSNNIPVTSFGDALLDNKGVEYAVVPNDEDITDEIIIDYYDSVDTAIDHPPKRDSVN